MKLSDFDYNLPEGLIAGEPASPRDHSRLLLLDKTSGQIEHKHFYDILDHLNPGDVLVLNNSKVFPARLVGKRKESGGRLEIFLLKKSGEHVPPPAKGEDRRGFCVWQCLVGGRRARPGLTAVFDKGLEGELLQDNNDGTWEVKFNLAYADTMKLVRKIGEVPLPPYIKAENRKQTTDGRKQKIDDSKSYQTVYARDDKVGSAAAPTAGLHFTPELMEKIKAKGVKIEYVTLHVGLGTFAPVKTDDILEHKMHAEFVEVDAETMANIYVAKYIGKRIIAVGTTSVRTLEAMTLEFPISNFHPSSEYRQFPKNFQLSNFQKVDFLNQFEGLNRFVNIFIYPGYEFKMIDGMITNFHLPKSTLMMLVSALAGKENIDKAYKEAIAQKYRFYSYGDAMFIY